MPVNQEELIKDLETPEYQKIVTESLKKKEYAIYTKDEHTAFQDRFKQNVIETEIAPKIKEVHDRYDKDTKELFGVDRNPEEKSYDYLKRAASVHLTKIKDLEEKIKAGDPTGALQKQLDETNAKYQRAIQEKDQEINNLRGEKTRTEKASAVMTIYADVKSKFKKTLPPLFGQAEKTILDGVIESAVLKDGKYYVGDGKGNPVLDKGFSPVLISDHLAEQFKELIEVTPAGGGGSGGGKPGEKLDLSKITVDNFLMPEGKKTKADVMDYLTEVGIPKGTPLYNKIYAKYAKDLPNV